MIQNCLYVMMGGALGALLRYVVAQLTAGIRVLEMPVGTFVVNVAGCFVLGVLTGLGHSGGVWLLLTVGVCGAFTTFSTFTAETVRAVETGHVWQAALYVGTSVSLGFLLFWWGKRAGEMMG